MKQEPISAPSFVLEITQIFCLFDVIEEISVPEIGAALTALFIIEKSSEFEKTFLRSTKPNTLDILCNIVCIYVTHTLRLKRYGYNYSLLRG